MYEVSIELDDDRHVAGLRAELRRRGFEVEELDGRPKVTVDLLGFRPEQRIEEVLNAVEDWLRAAGQRAVMVNVDGTSYRLSAPPSA
jgi:hypothetical protein